MAKTRFFKPFWEKISSWKIALCVFGGLFNDLDENDRLIWSLSSSKWSSTTFQIMPLSNSLRVSSESVFRCKPNHTHLSNRIVIGVLSSSLCFQWLCIVQSLFSFNLPRPSKNYEHSPLQWGFTWLKSHKLATTL